MSLKILPNASLTGIDISEHAIKNSKEEVKGIYKSVMQN